MRVDERISALGFSNVCDDDCDGFAAKAADAGAEAGANKDAGTESDAGACVESCPADTSVRSEAVEKSVLAVGIDVARLRIGEGLDSESGAAFGALALSERPPSGLRAGTVGCAACDREGSDSAQKGSTPVECASDHALVEWLSSAIDKGGADATEPELAAEYEDDRAREKPFRQSWGRNRPSESVRRRGGA